LHKDKLYRVIWAIDVEAASPKAAAKKALERMQIPTWATNFLVLLFKDLLYSGRKAVNVDLGLIEK